MSALLKNFYLVIPIIAGIIAILTLLRLSFMRPMMLSTGTKRRSKGMTSTGVPQSSKLEVSIAHARYLAKGYSSSFLISLYLPEMRDKVVAGIEELKENQPQEHPPKKTSLVSGQLVQLELVSPEISFTPKAKLKKLSSFTAVTFLGLPKNSCSVGNHQALLVIKDGETEIEYESVPFSVLIKDFAFDHVSRPVLSNAMTVVMGVGSLTVFILTLVHQLDTTLGLTSGTAIGALASAIHWRFVGQYQRSRNNILP